MGLNNGHISEEVGFISFKNCAAIEEHHSPMGGWKKEEYAASITDGSVMSREP